MIWKTSWPRWKLEKVVIVQASGPSNPSPAVNAAGVLLDSQTKGLIFDCDGTLADTMPLHWKAWQVIAQRHRLHFPEERFYALGGVPSRDILRMLGHEQGIEFDPLVVAKEKEFEYLPLIASVRPIQAVVSIAHTYHGKLPMAVASGGTGPIIRKVLENLGIRELFSAIVTSEEVTRQKPAPDIFLEAAHRIGIAPQFCCAFEDTELGLQSIRAAGMRAIDVRQMIESDE
jgi:beta-phosphoglucomutase-like phosphatase (HAD superfamily)